MSIIKLVINKATKGEISLMIDLHSHLLHGVDDGPSNIEQSLRMVEEAEKLGISLIVATPHYQEDIFEAEKVEENFQELVYRAKQFDVMIKMGYEVFINPYAPHIMRSKKRLGLNKSKGVLFDFPFSAKPSDCIDIIKKLMLENITPIISHPERNRNFLNHLGDMIRIIKSDCLIQVDAASIAGIYGKRIKEFSKEMIKMNIVDLIASNAHCASDYSNWYMCAYNNVIRWTGQENASKLFNKNALSLLESLEENSYISVIG